jgi:hypothetical protein
MPVQRRVADLGAPGDLVQRHLHALFGVHRLGGGQHSSPIALGISAHQRTSDIVEWNIWGRLPV